MLNEKIFVKNRKFKMDVTTKKLGILHFYYYRNALYKEDSD